MTTGSILLTIALIIVLLLYLLRPFLTPSTSSHTTTPRQKLLAEKEQLLNQIRALDFDHTTGKIPDDVYQAQRPRLIQQTALILQQLDSHAADHTDIEVAIETAVAHLRQHATPPDTNTQHGRFCPQCGQPTDTGDKFCTACGHQLMEVMK